MNISIVIPTLNEESTLPGLLDDLRLHDDCQIVVADGGSTDDTLNIASDFGAEVVETSAGRGIQLNAGAQIASGDGLFFVHADVKLPTNAVTCVRETLSLGFYVGGAFSIAIASTRPSFRFIFHMINVRSRYLNLPFGDQGIFVSREAFDLLGGFRAIPIMEDLDLVMRLNKIGPITLLPQKIIASSRRYDREGALYSTLRNWLLMILFTAGVNPDSLKALYPHVR